MLTMLTEQRRHPRYVCGGRAEIHVMSLASPLCAKIANLSVSGCRLLIDGQPKLSHNLIIEVAFTVNQLPFRVRGQVRSRPECSDPNQNAVGIEFMDVSPRTHDRLMELIEELEEKQSKLAPRHHSVHSHSLLH